LLGQVQDIGQLDLIVGGAHLRNGVHVISLATAVAVFHAVVVLEHTCNHAGQLVVLFAEVPCRQMT